MKVRTSGVGVQHDHSWNYGCFRTCSICAPSASATSRMQAGTLERPPHNTLPTFSATLNSTHLAVRKSVCRKPFIQPVLSKHILSIILTNWLILSIKCIYRKHYKYAYLHDQSPFTNPVDPVLWAPTNGKAETKQRGRRIDFIYRFKIWLVVGRVVYRKFHLASFHPATTRLSKIVNCVRRYK